MTRRQLEILDCLDIDIASLQARIAARGNAAMRDRLSKMKAARDDLCRFYSQESLMQERRSA